MKTVSFLVSTPHDIWPDFSVDLFIGKERIYLIDENRKEVAVRQMEIFIEKAEEALKKLKAGIE